MARIFRPILLTATVLAVIGCSGQPGGSTFSRRTAALEAPATRALKPVDPILLRTDVNTSLDRWLSRVMGLTTEIAAQTQIREIREACLRLKIRTATAVRMIAAQPDPRNGFLMAWIMAVQFRNLHTTGDFKDIFGEHQPRVIELAQAAVDNVMELGRRHFTPEEIEAAQPEIEQLASQIPMGERFLADRVPLALAGMNRQAESNAVGRLLAAPLTPLTTLQGVADTPQAINNVALSVGEFGQIIRDSPELLRWHLELLMYEANDLPVVVDARRDFERLAAAFQQLAQNVDTLPDDLRDQVIALLTETDASQEKLQHTLVEARRTFQQLDVTLDKAGATTRDITQATQAIAQLAAAGDQAPSTDREPITLDQVNQVLDRVAALVTEVRALTGQLHQPMPSDSGLVQTLADAQQRADASIAAAAKRLDQSIDRLVWRGALLIALAFAAAVLYRVIFRHRPA